MKNKFEIDEYFSDKEIIKILCKKRALAAKKTHDNHFLRNISSGAVNPNKSTSKEIYTYFPPRSEWIRLKRIERNKRNTNSVEINKIQLERTVFSAMKKASHSISSSPLWLSNLKTFINEIQRNVLDENSTYVIPKPEIIPVIKDKKKNEYRPISSFKLKDLIIIGQVSKYLTNCFDQLFLDCSYAFRTGINNKKQFNHHQAIHDIIKFNDRTKASYYVAECDIKKFYDCVSHNEIKVRFNTFIIKVKKEFGIIIDPRSIKLFESYLCCFSFNNDIAKNVNDLLKKVGAKNGSIPWVNDLELKEVGVDSNIENIGIPQGGALSCLIANIILDSVDRKVMEAGDDEMFYARFCDDMVLINTDETSCKKLFDIYQEALKEVKLISHKPIPLHEYSPNFWKIKSKSPYKWDECVKADERKSNVPWLSFVGYQVRYDNLVRIRKTSIEKELKKQVHETDKIIKVIKRGKKASINKKAIVFRLQQRLISMAVGRVQYNNKPLKMCWAAGFNVIKKNKNIKGQFLKLDRNRERQIKRMIRFVDGIKTDFKPNNKPIIRLKYYGKKYSYHNQFI